MKNNVLPHSELFLDMACRLGRMDLIQLLVEAGAAPTKTPVFSVVYKGAAEIMEYFFSRESMSTKETRSPSGRPLLICLGEIRGEIPQR